MNKSLFEYDSTTPENIMYYINVLVNKYGVSLETVFDNLDLLTPTNLAVMITKTEHKHEHSNS